MIIGIDASNIRTGGGKKHLEKFILNCLDEDKSISFIIVSNNFVNNSFLELTNIKCISNLLLNYGSLPSIISQLFISTYYFKTSNGRSAELFSEILKLDKIWETPNQKMFNDQN